MTGRSSKYGNFNNTDESPTNIKLDNTHEVRALKFENEKYKKLLEYNYSKNPKTSKLVRIGTCTQHKTTQDDISIN